MLASSAASVGRGARALGNGVGWQHTTTPASARLNAGGLGASTMEDFAKSPHPVPSQMPIPANSRVLSGDPRTAARPKFLSAKDFSNPALIRSRPTIIPRYLTADFLQSAAICRQVIDAKRQFTTHREEHRPVGPHAHDGPVPAGDFLHRVSPGDRDSSRPLGPPLIPLVVDGT